MQHQTNCGIRSIRFVSLVSILLATNLFALSQAIPSERTAESPRSPLSHQAERSEAPSSFSVSNPVKPQRLEENLLDCSAGKATLTTVLSMKAMLEPRCQAPGVGTGRRLVDLGRTLDVESFGRTLVVENLDKLVKARLLLQKIFGRWFGGFFLQGGLDALMTTILLGMTSLDASMPMRIRIPRLDVSRYFVRVTIIFCESLRGDVPADPEGRNHGWYGRDSE